MVIDDSHFKIPSDFLDKKIYNLSDKIKIDLDHKNTIDNINLNPFSKILLNSKNNSLNKILFERLISKYTTDTKYLKDYQSFIKNHNIQNLNPELHEKCMNKFENLKNTKNLHEHYDFIEYKQLDFLNKDPTFLQCMAYYTVSSPILSLLLPIIFLIIPFFIINTGKTMSFETYKNILFKQLKNHAVGKIFNIFDNNLRIDQKFVSIIPVFFFIFSTYQNIISTIRFYHKTNEICEFIYDIKNLMTDTIKQCDYLMLIESNHYSFVDFKNYLREKREKVFEFLNTFPDEFSPFLSTSSIFNIGKIKQLFYNLLHSNSHLLYFSNSLAGFISNINSIKTLYNSNYIAFCKFTKKNKTIINNQYFIDHTFVKNSVKLNKNYIITGPNASGKTTLLKSTLVNIILSQQFGLGFYKKCIINPYNYIHSYINIPDTSGRDSLFQAESRRCLDILNTIQNSREKERHFIIFDELYSGTNPYEATIAGKAFLNFITKFNVNFILTTHFDNLDNIYNTHNFNMKCKYLNNMNIKYHYKIIKGKSKIKGAFTILKDMGYPKEIIAQLY